MASFWDKIYHDDHTFFGEEPSKFALLCYSGYMKDISVKKMLELGCGQEEIRYFLDQRVLKYPHWTIQKLQDLLDIKEVYEEPVTLYLVSIRKKR
jgi:hypothetical protein